MLPTARPSSRRTRTYSPNSGPVHARFVRLGHHPGGVPGALEGAAPEPVEAAGAARAQVGGGRRGDALQGEALGAEDEVVVPVPLGEPGAAGKVAAAGGPQQGRARASGPGRTCGKIRVRTDSHSSRGRFVGQPQALGDVVGVQQHLGDAHRGEALAVRAAEGVRVEGAHLAAGSCGRWR